MTTSDFQISGVSFDEAYNYRVVRSISDNNSTSSFKAFIDNYNGRNKTDFVIGDEIIIRAQTLNNYDASIKGYWRFEGSPIVDSIQGDVGSIISGAGNPGVAFTDPTFVNSVYPSIMGSALKNPGSPTYIRFDDNANREYISGPDDYFKPFTLAYWVSIPSGTTLTGSQYFVHASGATNNGLSFGTSGTGQLVLVPTCRRGNNQAGAEFTTTGSHTIGGWDRVVWAFNGSPGSFICYMNGTEIGNRNATANAAGMASMRSMMPKMLFRSATDCQTTSGVIIDDLRWIVGSAWNASQVLSDYNNGNGTVYISGADFIKIFTGILEDVNFTSRNQDDKIMLSGRDYTARLMDRTVEPEVYTNLLAGSIIKDIISKYTNNITTVNVNGSGAFIDRIAFNQKPVYDALRQLSELSGFTFYVDVNKDLHFEPIGSISSGFTFDSGNIITSDFNQQRDTLYNQIWVYGDRYLDGYKETFNAGSPLGGSIFTLTYKPHNTQVSVSGAIIQPGDIYLQATNPGSNIRYLVDYNDKRIIFTSGTNQGANIPQSGNSVVVDYKRSLPIVKVGDNESSKAQYGTRVKVIVDKDIKDPETATQIMQSELEDLGNPATEGNLDIYGFYNVIPGNTVVVNMPNQNVSNITYNVLESTYDFSKENNLSDEVLSLKVSKKIKDFTDVMKQALLDIKKLQGNDISDSDVITRFQFTTGSVLIRQSGLFVSTSTSLGSQYHLWSTGFTPPITPMRLASGTNQGWLAGSSTLSGPAFGPFTVQWSGGFF